VAGRAPVRGIGFITALVCALALVSYPLFFMGREAPPEVPDLMVLEIASFDDLPGWGTTDLRPTIDVFDRSCRRIALFGGVGQPMGGEDLIWGLKEDWQEPCQGLNNYHIMGRAQLEEDALGFFQSFFTPIRIRNNAETTGLFTGYYEPELRGNRTQSEEFNTPLLSRPEDLVMVQLRDFPGDYNGRIAGRVVDGNLRPYESREEIEASGVAGAEPIVWIDDPVDAFFLHIQGSGRVVLDDGSVVRVGYAGQNGHPYTAIGRILVQEGNIALEDASMQSIRTWLATHEGPEANRILNTNASYIFFTELDIPDPNLGPLGASGIQLTPEVSLAVDRRYHALGAPVYVAMETPDGEQFNRLMVSQDTGGAIRGPIRGDVFWGFGDDAAAMAGRMRSQGEMWVLVPNAVAERIAAAQEADLTDAAAE